MRWVIRATLALVLALGAGLAGLFLLPQERIARIAADQLEAQTGRRVEIAPPLSVSLWPVLGVDTGPVTVANAPWAGPEPMLEADGLSLGLSAPELLRGTLRVTHVVARAPVLRLSEDASGRGNRDISSPAAAPAASAPQEPTAQAALPVLERLELSGARLIHTAPGTPPLDLSGVDLVFDWPDPSGVANIALSLPWRGAPVKLAATSPDLPALLQGAVARVTAEVSAPGGTLRFAGRASTSGAAAGQVTLEAVDTGRLMTSAGLDAPAIPPGLGRRAALRAELTYTPDGRLALRDLDMTLDGNRLRGAADFTLSGKPVFNARLTAGALDLRGAGPVAPASSPSASARASAPGWRTEPIDASALTLADGALALTAASIALPQTELGRTEVLLTLDRARAVLSLNRVEAFGGLVTGELVANNRGGLSVGGKLTMAQVSAEHLLGDLAGTKRLSGRASGDLQFLGVGQSEAQIMASLSGRGGLSMGQGRLAGFDLDALMAGDKSLRGTTVFDRLSAGFTMDGGTLRNDDLALSLPNFRVDGAGRVGLGARDIDYLLTPTALRPRGGQGLALPIRIKGPWADPKIRPEIDDILKAKADVKIEAVREEAKEQVRQKLSEELDTQITDEETLKDAVKSRLKDKARGGLLNLLERN